MHRQYTAMPIFWLACPLTILSMVISSEKNCGFKENITDIEELAHHKYRILEDCLFYHLVEEADKMQNGQNALMLLPPSIASGETLDVDILSASLTQLWTSEAISGINIQGTLVMTWKDRRMKWDIDAWKTDKLNVGSFTRLWMPDIGFERSSYQNNEYIQFTNIIAKSNGNVTADLEFKTQIYCNIDYQNFPDDQQQCCLTMKSSFYPHYIKYFVVRGENEIDVTNLKSNWHVQEVSIMQEPDLNDKKAQTIRLCLSVERRSMALHVELTIPMIISSLFVIIAPFFGEFKEQLNVKLFSVFIQLLSFIYLSSKTPQSGFGNVIPNIYIFYVFTIGISMISLLVTLILSALARTPRRIPPAHRYTLFATLFNSNICCGTVQNSTAEPTTEKNTYYDWLQIFSAVNNIFSFFILVAYTLGTFIILNR